MKLVVLTGNANRGKSSTLRIVYDVLQQLGFNVTDNILKRLGSAEQNDFIDIVLNNDAKVGIATMGDYEEKCKECIEEETVQGLYRQLVNVNCTIIILACNVKLSKAIEFLKEYDAIVFNKQESKNHNDFKRLNSSDALKIVKEIIQ
jgi:RNase adaptor protein for sRNA GlmZ degradation